MSDSVGTAATLAVLGSTGSIGEQTLDVAAREPARLRVTALAAGRALDRLCEQAAAVAARVPRARAPGRRGRGTRARSRAAAPGAHGRARRGRGRAAGRERAARAWW